MRSGFSIRTKLLLVAMLLLLIPWMSYVYVRDMKTYLLAGQEDALTLTSRAVATVLHGRPELFSEQSSFAPDEIEGNEIYAAPLPNFINVNGDLSDWGEQAKQTVTSTPSPVDTLVNPENVISVDHAMGYRGNFIYALFKVTDDEVIFRQPEFLRVDAADHIRLTLQEPNRPQQRYTIISGEPGRMSIYLMDEAWQYPVTGKPNYDLSAELKLTSTGYNVELRIPRFMLNSDTRVSVAVTDVDNPDTYEIEAIVRTTPQSDNDLLSKLLVRSPEIDQLLIGLKRSDTRIWVFGEDNEIPRTVVGEILNAPAAYEVIKPVNTGQHLSYAWNLTAYYYNVTLQTVFNFIIEQQSDVAPSSEQEQARNYELVQQALEGSTPSIRIESSEGNGVILMSAHPVYSDDKILGAVVVEQSTNQVTRQQQAILENVISITLLVLITVATALLLFSSRLTLRIRRLRNATETAIDRDGRILHQRLNAEAKAGDEIGDLSRSVSNMLGRLSQYTNYLKGLPDTLAHEVSNPLNVVNSSLHNLSREAPELAESKYMARAQNGLNRIGSILRNLTEAANLEQAMQSETREQIDLVELIESYVDGYSFSNPDQPFDVVIQTRPLPVEIAPDYIAQALDKLVDNAIDFAAKDTPIVVKAKRLNNFAQIDIINRGSRLPEGMAERIFEPLVSLGRKDAQKISLGMGLYIVKLIASFHGGEVIARNLLSSDGVIFSLSLPIYEPHANAI